VSASRTDELCVAVLARLIGDTGHVAVGNASPIPGMAALLAQSRSQGRVRVSMLNSRRHNTFTDGGRELFDCAGQGRIDVFFLGGGEIDGEANLNLVGVGDPERPDVRFPGSFGSAYLYFTVPRVILFREEHSPRVLVPKVSFVSAPGTSPDNVYRPGGPVALLTGKALFSFDKTRKRFRLESTHPGESIDSVREATGFEFDTADEVAATPEPDPDMLELIRGPVARDIAETYPQFAARLPAA
jgi:glutaconate CoA-transferase, subunit B